MAGTSEPPGAVRRGRGSRAGLTRDRIVAAARGLGVEKVTVKAVADRLGVDRAAVHHHVRDLDHLRELVALDAFRMRLASVAIPPDAHWRDACRALATSIHDAVLLTGGLGVYIQLRPTDMALLEPVEHTLRIMMAAGFDDGSSAHSLATLASLATALGRERVVAQRTTGHPHVPELRRALEGSGGDLQILRRLAQADLVNVNDEQLNASIELILDGMEVRLARSPRRT